MQFRLKPGNMIMHDAVPYGQLWTYYAEHPIDEMLKPEYLRSHDGLRSGDQIMVNQVEKGRVLEIAMVMVTNTKPFELFTILPKTSVQKKKPGPKPKAVVNG